MSPAHLVVAPIVLPLAAGAALLVLERSRPRWLEPLAHAATLAFAALAVALLVRAGEGATSVYLLGNWRAPFGIALALDRTAALFLALTAALAIASRLASGGAFAARAPHFHAVFQFQLAGLAGAFLTADLFNLFVFFEVLLIASYALLLHGAQGPALRRGFAYIVVNLVASTLFLVAASLAYGVAGTLNLPDLAVRVAALQGVDLGLARAALLLLLAVFAVKAAIVPFGFWITPTYSAVAAPVAALFAIMTKVGVYAILRVAATVWGGGRDTGFVAGTLSPLLLVLGLATIVYGACGALAANRLAALVASLVAVSSGLAVAVFAAAPANAGGVLYYVAQSSLVAAALFLIAGGVAAQRGASGDSLRAAAFAADGPFLGIAFLAGAVAMAGLPPLPGFVGKVLMLRASAGSAWAGPLWFVVLASGLAALVALSRAGIRVFWKPAQGGATAAALAPPAADRAALGWLFLLVAALAVLAGPAVRYADAAAAQLADPRGYVEAVLGAAPVPSAAHGAP